MTDTERLAALERTQKELLRTVETIKTNDLPHLGLAIEDVREELDNVSTAAQSAKFRGGLTIVGLVFIGIMITLLGVIVAVTNVLI